MSLAVLYNLEHKRKCYRSSVFFIWRRYVVKIDNKRRSLEDLTICVPIADIFHEMPIYFRFVPTFYYSVNNSMEDKDMLLWIRME